MADIKITTHSGLIEATIKSKQETYYLVTEDNLNSLKTKSLFNDLFVLLASLAWGTYFSIVITIKSIPQIDPETAKNTIQPLLTLRDVSFFASIVFTVLTALMFYQSFDQIKNIKKGKLELNDPQPNQGQPNQGQQNDGQQNGAQ